MENILIPDKVKNIIKKFAENGAEIYVVGGAVRDLMLGREVNDWDFTTNLNPEEMKKLFPKNSFYNNNFGTLSIVEKDGEIFEVTTFRTERGYSDGRHPDEIKWGKSLAEDLERRDFTINALAIEVQNPLVSQSSTSSLKEGGSLSKYKIIDLFEGQKDLENKLVRTVRDPDEIYKEDA